MDFNPLIPNVKNSHDISHILSEAFEDTLRTSTFPSNVADNIVNNNVKPEYGLLKKYGQDIKEHKLAINEAHGLINITEAEIMKHTGNYLVNLKRIATENNDANKLRNYGVFNEHNINANDLELIDKPDLLPNFIEQSLDFTYNAKLHQCGSDHKVSKTRKDIFLNAGFNDNFNCELNKNDVRKTDPKIDFLLPPLKLEPESLTFENYEPDITYVKSVHLQNCCNRSMPFYFTPLPRDGPFYIKQLTKLNHLAPGMSVEFEVKYRTEIYSDDSAEVPFSTIGGFTVKLKLLSFRQPPHLRVYVFRSLRHTMTGKCPGSLEFWEKRCTALNDTIDCGHCILGLYNYMSLIIGNVGATGKFIFLPEDEWIDGSNSIIPNSLEFHKDCFKIFPSYILIEENEVSEVCLMFTPKSAGFHVEKLYILSNNNTYKSIELIGDGLYFTRDLIKVKCKSQNLANIESNMLNENDDEDAMGLLHKIDLGSIENCTKSCITLTVINSSAIYLKFYWLLKNECGNTPLDLEWISLKNGRHEQLSPYTTYDFDFEISPNASCSGQYEANISLFIANIPETGLLENEEFTVTNKSTTDGVNFVDILVSDIKLVCIVKLNTALEENINFCSCTKRVNHNQVKLSKQILDFGLIPNGEPYEYPLYIENLTNKKVKWKIIEIMYNIDVKPSVFVIRKPLVSETQGIFDTKRYPIFYTIDPTKSTRWVSILLLFTENEGEELRLNSTCLVIYDVIQWNFQFSCPAISSSKEWIVASKKLLYLNVKTTLEFCIQNNSLLSCPFCFFPPEGEDAHKLDMVVIPFQGEIQPLEKKTFKLVVVPKDVGIVENVHLPFYYNKYLPPFNIKIIVPVDNLNVYFFLPNPSDHFYRILWPPKVLNEIDYQSLISFELMPEDEITFHPSSINQKSIDEDTKNNLSLSEYSTGDKNYSTNQTKTDSDSMFNIPCPLVEFLKNKFNLNFLKHDYVVELKGVWTKEFKSFPIYIQNITPIAAEFTIKATNFETKIEVQNEFINAMASVYPNTGLIKWEEACSPNGLVIIPDIREGYLGRNEVVCINLWIYANTWGVYMDEIVIELGNITSFCFSLFIEVMGTPIEFPFAVNTIRNYPTLRFGHIPYCSEPVSRILNIKNTSTVPITIQWYLFSNDEKEGSENSFNTIVDLLQNMSANECRENLRLFITNKAYGQQEVKFMKIKPHETSLKPSETADLQITLNPRYFPVNPNEINISCSVVGYIFLTKKYESQVNIFYRLTAEYLKPLQVKITSVITMPLLKLDMLSGNSKIEAFASNILDGQSIKETINLIFKNNNLNTVTLSFHIGSPFEIENINIRDYKSQKSIAIIKPNDVVELKIKCVLKSADITNMANWCYCNEKSEEKVCTKNKTVELHRHLNIHQKGLLEQSLPLVCKLYYPKLEVIPAFLKFQHVLLGNKKKLNFVIYNSTHCDIKFRIQQQITTGEFSVEPLEGNIPKMCGLSRGYTNIFVRFKPEYYKFYQDSLRICINIPQYRIDVPVNGYGIQNEKFSVDNVYFQP